MADSFGNMSKQIVLPLKHCSDPALVGGKAAGLGLLIRNSFHVPPGMCLTTQAYKETLQAAGLDLPRQWTHIRRAAEPARGQMLDDCRRLIASLTFPQTLLDLLNRELNCLGIEPATLLAVRSSATDEDVTEATFGGQYRTVLGMRRDALGPAILDCWASLWTATAFAYRSRMAKAAALTAPPAMAVIIQPLLAPHAAGVAYSRHPVTGQGNQVVINAVFGLAEPLMSGTAMPDQYVVKTGEDHSAWSLIQHDIAEKTSARVASGSGLADQPLPEQDRRRPVLDDHAVLALARLAKEVEPVVGKPVDIEWALDRQGFWLLQARPIPSTHAVSDGPIVWSRANFKETLPDLPCPLTLSFVDEFMEVHILRHYREAGCEIPSGLSSMRVIRGRPYINVTLFQSLTAQLGGDPDSVTEQMGGEIYPPPPPTARLAWWKLFRAGLLLQRKVFRAAGLAQAWFAELKQGGKALAEPSTQHLTEQELLARHDALSQRLGERDLTFAIVGGVSQALHILGVTLRRRTKDWRPLLNEATQGLGNIISADQILWLVKLAETAEGEPVVCNFLLAEAWAPEEYRDKLSGTSFLKSFDAFLEGYGHRAIGESDVMSPRFAETPDYILGIIRGHLLARTGHPSRSVEAIHRDQAALRQAALDRIRAVFGWRLHEWLWFRWWHRFLCRYLELREANRHHQMYYTMGSRHLLLLLGDKLTARGLLDRADDVFFLLPEEIKACAGDSAGGHKNNWKQIVAARRVEQKQHAKETAPDTVILRGHTALSPVHEATPVTGTLTGIPISAGYAEGPVRLLLSPEDTKKVRKGDILVAPVIDPGMAPLLGLAAGLVVEMGGTLSHGAIVAREYGLPALANVRGVTRLLKDGELIAVDATTGKVSRLEAC